MSDPKRDPDYIRMRKYIESSIGGMAWRALNQSSSSSSSSDSSSDSSSSSDDVVVPPARKTKVEIQVTLYYGKRAHSKSFDRKPNMCDLEQMAQQIKPKAKLKAKQNARPKTVRYFYLNYDGYEYRIETAQDLQDLTGTPVLANHWRLQIKFQ